MWHQTVEKGLGKTTQPPGHHAPWHLAGPTVWYLSVSDSSQMVAWREITHTDKHILADIYSLAYSCLTQIIHGCQMQCRTTVLNTCIQIDAAQVPYISCKDSELDPRHYTTVDCSLYISLKCSIWGEMCPSNTKGFTEIGIHTTVNRIYCSS